MAAEVTLLDAARRGDEAAFEQLVAPHRAELHAHCKVLMGHKMDGRVPHDHSVEKHIHFHEDHYCNYQHCN